MSVFTITFSPTGGTQKCADLLANGLAPSHTVIDLTDRTLDFASIAFSADDICVIAVPAYGGRVPDIAVSRLRQLRGSGARAVLGAVYGNRAFEDTLLELRDTLEAAGFRPVAAVTALAEHSIVREIAAGQPDDTDAAQLAGFAAKIRERLESGFVPEPLAVPGNVPYRTFGGVPLKPQADPAACDGCGKCAALCPVGAIPADQPAETDAAACISCMRCLSVCPNSARAVNPDMLAGLAQKLNALCGERKQNELFL